MYKQKELSLYKTIALILSLMALLGFAVPAFMDYTVVENGLKVQGEGGTATPVLVVNRVGTPGVGSVVQFQVNKTPVANIGGNGLSGVGQSDFWRYQDVAAAPDVRAEAAVVSTTTTVGNLILGIETPRNLVLTWVTVTTATAGNVSVLGTNARGISATDVIAVAAVSGTQTLAGAVPFQFVTVFTLPTRTEAVTLTVKGGQKFGLPRLPVAASDLYHLTVNITPAIPTVNPTLGTFDPVSTPAANVDYNVWLK